MINGQNGLYSSHSGETCPENIEVWQYFNQGKWNPTEKSFSLRCISGLNDQATVETDNYEDYEEYELIEATTTEATTTTEWTTTPWTTMTTTTTAATGSSESIWAPWSQCSSTCQGTQTRNYFSSTSSTTNQIRPCGVECPKLSDWFEWSDCSAWCDFGIQIRRRLCVQGNSLSNKCPNDAAERFEKRKCYLSRCPSVDYKVQSTTESGTTDSVAQSVVQTANLTE